MSTGIAHHMRSAACTLIEALDTEQRTCACRAFPDDEERRLWFFTPTDHGGLALGQGIIAGLIGPSVTFFGEVARERSGSLELAKLDVAGGNVTVTASGQYSNDVIELDHIVDIPKLSNVQPELAGGATQPGPR